MNKDDKEKLKKILKDPQERHKLEKALVQEAAERVAKKLREAADKAQENWPDVKDKIQEKLKNIPDEVQKAKQGAVGAAKFGGRTVKKLVDWALKNKKSAALVMAAVLTISGAVVHFSDKQKREMKKAVKMEKVRLKQLGEQVNQPYNIDSEDSFKKLFDDALPLVQSSFFSSEVFKSDAYADDNKTINTAGAGSWWFPKNGNPKSSEWIPVREYVKSHPNLAVDGNMALALIDGWFRSRDGGRIYKKMCRKLQGCELNINEFVAICGVIYNNEEHGFALCDYVKKNHDNPAKVARYITSLRPKNEQFELGIMRRHTAEALLYLNPDNMIADLGAWRVKSVGKNCSITPISLLSPDECQKLSQSLEKGETDYAAKLAKKMSHWICRHDDRGQAVFRQVQKEVKDTAWSNPMLNFVGDTLNVTGDSPYWGDVLYDQAREYNECGKCNQAADKYEELFDKGFYGADLHIDAAKNYLDMKEYEKCRAQCRLAINGTGETHQVKKAYEFAIEACVAMGDSKGEKINRQKLASLNQKAQQRAAKGANGKSR